MGLYWCAERDRPVMEKGGALARGSESQLSRAKARGPRPTHPVGTCKDAGARESLGVTQAPEGICTRHNARLGRTEASGQRNPNPQPNWHSGVCARRHYSLLYVPTA